MKTFPQNGKFAYLTDKVLIDKSLTQGERVERERGKEREQEKKRDNNAALLFEIKTTKLKWKFATSLAKDKFHIFQTHTQYTHTQAVHTHTQKHTCTLVVLRLITCPITIQHTMHTQRPRQAKGRSVRNLRT